MTFKEKLHAWAEEAVRRKESISKETVKEVRDSVIEAWLLERVIRTASTGSFTANIMYTEIVVGVHPAFSYFLWREDVLKFCKKFDLEYGETTTSFVISF